MTTTTDTLVLQHNDRVRLATWVYPYDRATAAVFTVEGYAGECDTSPAEAVEMSQKRGHALAATIYIGAALLGDASAREAQAAKEKAELERAYILTEGQEVLIEGRRYTVHAAWGNTNGPKNSDPLTFRPVGG